MAVTRTKSCDTVLKPHDESRHRNPRSQGPTRKENNPNAVALGRLGAKARQLKLTSEQRREIAQKAIRARWTKTKKKGKKDVKLSGGVGEIDTPIVAARLFHPAMA